MSDKSYQLKVELSDGTIIDAGTFVAPQGPEGISVESVSIIDNGDIVNIENSPLFQHSIHIAPIEPYAEYFDIYFNLINFNKDPYTNLFTIGGIVPTGTLLNGYYYGVINKKYGPFVATYAHDTLHNSQYLMCLVKDGSTTTRPNIMQIPILLNNGYSLEDTVTQLN